MPSQRDEQTVSEMGHGVTSAQDDQSMWPDGDEPGDAQSGEEGEEAKQLRYLQDAPEWAMLPPNNSEFANATWLEGDGQARALVAEVFAFDEFSALAPVGYEVRWRRQTKPARRSRRGSEPLFVTVAIVDARVIWEAEKQGCETYPRLWIDLAWQNFQDRREDAPFYVHHDEVRAHLHHALSALNVTNDRISRFGPDVSVFAKTAERYVGYQQGMRDLKRSMMLMPDVDEDEES